MTEEWRNLVGPFGTILRNYWQASRGTIALVLLIVTGASIASVSAPYVFSRLIDRLSADAWAETIFAGFALYAVLMGLSLALQHMVRYLAVMSAENLNLIAATSFFGRLVRKPTGFFVQHNPAEIQTAQVRGAEALNIVAQLSLIAVVPGIVQLVLALSVLGAVIDIEVVAVVVVYGLIFVVLINFANRWTLPHLENAAAAGQENAKFIGNAIGAMETLRYFGSTQWMSERFSGSAGEVFESWRRFAMKRSVFAGIHGAALAVQFMITFALLLPRYREGLISVGDIVLFNALLLQLNQPFEMAGHAIDQIARAYARFIPFARMWAAPEETGPTRHVAFIAAEGRLGFRGVSFSYEDGRGIGDVSFEAKRGRITFITGETGSGKSTIFKLALKSLEPAGGEIVIDGVNLRNIDRTDWYAAIGVVPQDVMLLNDTLATNITLGRPLDEERLRAAAAKAAILERIDELPQGFDTVVGERGMKLSGGERQRVAIARALYGGPKFLFLDEASSALDEATEREIMDHIRRIAGEVTVLAITHRKSTIRPEDHVVELAGGRQPIG